LRTVCIVNNYNYSNFLEQCLSSAMKQGLDLLIMVDDGSTDSSIDLIRSFAATNPTVVPILKSNGGQLSCFEAALPYVTQDDLVFFLDADDLFPLDYVSEVRRLHAQECADFYFCNAIEFRPGMPPLESARIKHTNKIRRFERTQAYTVHTGQWIGAPTSTISMTGKLLHELLPHPHPEQWKVRADDVLVYGASICGATKVKIDFLGVAYRIHGKNLFANNASWQSDEKAHQHKRHVEQLFQHYGNKFQVPRSPKLRLLRQELKLFPTKLPRDAARVIRQKRISLLKRFIRAKFRAITKGISK
jgi:glycosyltransferase involved in cell wall biosynthesis